jgi:hypothetical protein
MITPDGTARRASAFGIRFEKNAVMPEPYKTGPRQNPE